MRTVHYCNVFSPLSQTFIYDYVTELERQGVGVHFVTQRRENEGERPFSHVSLIDAPSRWHPERMWYRTRALFGTGEASESSIPIVQRRIREKIEQLAPDVIHAHFGPEGVLLGPVAQQLGLPLVVSFHGYDAFELPQRDGWREKYGALFQQIAAVTVVSRLMAEAIEQLGCPSERIHLVRVGKRISDYPLRAEPLGAIRRWVFVGRFSEKKAPLDAVQAFEQLVREDREQTLRMIGEGPLFDDVEAYIQSRGLGENVLLLGPVPHGQVKEEMSTADAFVLPSKTASSGDMEGVPTVLMEAQALGVPCVTTKHSGIPEVIPEENKWLLAEEGDVGSLADRMMRLSQAPLAEIRAIVERGRRKVDSEFNLETESARLIRLYRVVSGASSASLEVMSAAAKA